MKSRLLILLLRFFAVLPLPAARALGVLLGDICWFMRGRMARTTLKNLSLCFPHLDDTARRRLAKESLRHTFMAVTESGAVWLWPAPRALALIHRVEGLNLLQAAHAEGRGVIMLGPHLGNWELTGLYLNTAGCGQNSQLFQAPDDPLFAKLIYEARSRSGSHMVPTDQKGVGVLLQALRRGEVIGILPDQVPPDSGGEFAPFFGIPALTMTLACRLQQKTGARMLMTFARRELGPEQGFTVVIQEPDVAIYANDMPEALSGLNRSIEALMAGVPEQYQWEYKRFKRQPAGHERPY
ncbi:MAG TPA: lysophospholipid acyltransferase family protein [Pseudomonadales bacterium]